MRTRHWSPWAAWRGRWQRRTLRRWWDVKERRGERGRQFWPRGPSGNPFGACARRGNPPFAKVMPRESRSARRLY